MTATAGPDVDLDHLAGAAAPASCGAPVRQLRRYRDGGVGSVSSHLQVEEGYGPGMAPVPSVSAHLTGDGAKDALVVLSCTVGGDPRPDHLVLSTSGARPSLVFDLDGVQRQRYGVVRTLRAAAGGVRVEWTAFDSPRGPVTQYEGFLTWDGKTLVMNPRGPSQGPHAAQVTAGAFVTTDGNVRCVVHEGVAGCEAARVTWRPPAAPRGGTAGPAGTAPPSSSRQGLGAGPAPRPRRPTPPCSGRR